MQAGAGKDDDGSELRLSEQRAQLAIDVARLGTWTWAAQEVPGALSLDARCREICGLPAAGAPDHAQLRTRIHPDDLDRVRGALRAAFDPAGDGVFNEDIRFVHADGSVHWTAARGCCRPRWDGASELFGSLVDITARVSFNDRYRALSVPVHRLVRAHRHHHAQARQQ